MMAEHGYPVEAAAIAEAWARGDREAADRAVSDDLIDATASPVRRSNAVPGSRLYRQSGIDGRSVRPFGAPAKRRLSEAPTRESRPRRRKRVLVKARCSASEELNRCGPFGLKMAALADHADDDFRHTNAPVINDRRKGCRHGQGYRPSASAGRISSLKESDRVARLTDGAGVIQPSKTAIASISTIASGSARRLIWTVVLVGVAGPK
jgi:hypothetical protein